MKKNIIVAFTLSVCLLGIASYGWDNAQAYIDAGSTKGEKGDYDGAIKDYNKAIKLDSKNIPAYYGRGLVNTYMGEEAKATQDFNKVMEISPKNAGDYYLQGLAKEHLNQFTTSRNLKQIGTALISYYVDNNFGPFPTGNNAVGLSKLNTYLKSTKMLICPSTGHTPSSYWSPNMNCDYIYVGGYKVDDLQPNTGIACDAIGNFKDAGVILFADGHVGFFTGTNWISNANNPELEKLAKESR